MGRLIYTVIGSLDGYLADESGGFDWAAPDEEVLAFVNRREESVAADVSGPTLASDAFRAGLIDEVQLILAPVIVGAGKSYHPAAVAMDLDLVDLTRFSNGMVWLRYDVIRGQAAAPGGPSATSR